MATRIPIGFEDKQDDVWSRMEQDMERRRREWQNEIDNMSKDFFQLRTEKERPFGSLSNSMNMSGSRSDGKGVIEKDQHGNPVFRASFNVEEFKPEEVNVKMDARKITVHAKHEEKGECKSVSREYSRELHIPNEIDPMALQCKIGNDGVLTIEAPLPVPDYDKGSIKTNISQTSTASAPPSLKGHSSSGVQPNPSVKQTFSEHSSKAPSVSFRDSPPPSVAPAHHISTATHFTSGPGASTTFQAAPPYSSVTKGCPPRTGSPITVLKDKMFKIEIDIEDFCPEELTVKTQDNKLNIIARREIKTGNRKSTKEISREFIIPNNVDPMMVKAFFTDGGKLVVEAPFINPINGGATLTGR